MCRWIFAVFLAAGCGAAVVHAQTSAESAHIAIENPAELTKEEAQEIYDDMSRRMARGYAASRLDLIAWFQDWPRFNDAPYVSATHGQRYVNSYANKVATNYATLKPGEKLPVGTVLAKDSVTVTDDGRVFPGALFVMEKLAAGKNPDTADWRYIMVMPDGSLFGDTMGSRRAAVAYCHVCHEAVADRDYTFFVPEDYIAAK
ncbi:cytochrome P460 family protein [Ruegeria jejuensis]|uniref:cytochrome P460 family protein n=1 Tax=Ruegeria jejuensis TaxID=3233338 RepID=UPI00355B0E3E